MTLIQRRERVKEYRRQVEKLEREAAELRHLIRDEEAHILWMERVAGKQLAKG